jgi:BirA family transcriptional regulator, biotin operon repressor / biotin---[acetyl-CoA-carboxylase] ligase
MTVSTGETRAALLVVGNAAWKVHCHASLASTSDMARGLPAWSAVFATEQTAGRGRYGRRFSSRPGGLWLTAIVPATEGSTHWNGFSLSVGHSLLGLLQRLGVPGARLRWPNDLMANNRKLAGILIEETGRETLAVGLGINIFNRPWEEDIELESIAVRMADLVARPPDATELIGPVLDAISDAHDMHARTGLAPVVNALNEEWFPRNVRLALHGGDVLHVIFEGLDPNGNLRIAKPDGSRSIVPHHHVHQLTET